jgi:hypothetical protein
LLGGVRVIAERFADGNLPVKTNQIRVNAIIDDCDPDCGDTGFCRPEKLGKVTEAINPGAFANSTFSLRCMFVDGPLTIVNLLPHF